MFLYVPFFQNPDVKAKYFSSHVAKEGTLGRNNGANLSYLANFAARCAS